MEIQYQNTRADFKALYEDLMRDRKAAQRSDYYQGLAWFCGVVLLAGFIAFQSGEIFATCVFAALGGYYLKGNWSFARQWEGAAESYAAMASECSCTLVIDEQGLTERSSGVELKASWATIHEYAILNDRLLIHFLQYRAFIIPFRHLSPTQRDELTKTLEEHNVRQRQ